MILLGIKGFTETGIPLSKSKNLTGTTGKTVGIICVAFGGAAALVGFGLMILFAAR